MPHAPRPARPSGPGPTRTSIHSALQAMWEDQWMLLRANGKAEWLNRHGLPPLDCPDAASLVLFRALHRLLEDWTLPPYGELQPLRISR